MTDEEIQKLRALVEAATPGPWRALRDGNQYLNTRYMPTARLVGASRIEGVERPWNPHAYLAFGFKPEEFETVRFTDADADFVAAARQAVPKLIDALEHERAHPFERLKAMGFEIDETGLARQRAYEREIVALTERAENAEAALKAPEVHWECQQKIDALELKVNVLRAALAEALDLFEANWCTEWGHQPRPEAHARAAELRKLVDP